MAFPQTDLIIVVEMAFGADLTASPTTYVWTNVTEWMHGQDPVRITRGYQDESDQVSVGYVLLTLDNADGRWDPLNPTGPYYGLLGLDTPVRIRIDPGVAVTNATRFCGYISELMPSWDDGPDHPRVHLRADSILRRAERSTVVRSCLTRMMIGSAPLAYWPLEDESDATVGAPALATHREMRGSREIEWASDQGRNGTASLPKFPVQSSLVGPVPVSTATSWAVHFMFKGALTESGSVDLATWRTGGGTVRWEVHASNVRVDVTGYDSDGTQVYFDVLLLDNPWDGNWHSVMVRASLSGGNMLVWIGFDDVISSVTTLTGTSYPVQSMVVQNKQHTSLSRVDEVWLGHAAVFDRLWTEFDEAFLASEGYAGESAAARWNRVTTEVGIHHTVDTGAAEDQAMGAQRPARDMDVIREIASTDGGILGDTLDGRAHYIARSELTDRAVDDTRIWATLSVRNGDIYLPFNPAYDDQQYLNDVIASRPGGSSARYTVAEPMRGNYQGNINVNPATDEQLYSLAAWRVFKSALVGYRHPMVSLSFTGSPGLIPQWLSTAGGMAGRFMITAGLVGMPIDPIDLLVIGYVETISAEDYTVTVNARPSRGFRFGVLDSATYSRLDTAGSQLVSGVSEAATSLSVATTTGPIWITTATHPAEFPFDIRIGGEDMTVTAITGSSSPQTFTVQRSFNGVVKAHPAAAAVSLRHPLYLGI